MSPTESIKMFVDYCRRIFTESREGLKKMSALEIVILAAIIAVSAIIIAAVIYSIKFIAYMVVIVLAVLALLVLASWIIKAISDGK